MTTSPLPSLSSIYQDAKSLISDAKYQLVLQKAGCEGLRRYTINWFRHATTETLIKIISIPLAVLHQLLPTEHCLKLTNFFIETSFGKVIYHVESNNAEIDIHKSPLPDALTAKQKQAFCYLIKRVDSMRKSLSSKEDGKTEDTSLKRDNFSNKFHSYYIYENEEKPTMGGLFNGQTLILEKSMLDLTEKQLDFALAHEFHHFSPEVAHHYGPQALLFLASIITNIALLFFWPMAIIPAELLFLTASDRMNRPLESEIDLLACKHLGTSEGAIEFFSCLKKTKIEGSLPNLYKSNFTPKQIAAIEDRFFGNYHFSHPTLHARIKFLRKHFTPPATTVSSS